MSGLANFILDSQGRKCPDSQFIGGILNLFDVEFKNVGVSADLISLKNGRTTVSRLYDSYRSKVDPGGILTE